jgi:chemotaxis protein MotB
MADENSIIIIKKKSGHAGHHGGAWKVAYADFVTAMMALFIVLWLLNTKPPIKEAIAGYFNDPSGKGKQSGSAMAGRGETMAIKRDEMDKLKDKLVDAMKKMPDFSKIKDQVEMTVTGEGLRIELLETEHGMFFESGNSQPSPAGKELLEKLASEVGKLNNRVLIEGHTDARPFSAHGYTNWELSADRANAARRLMQQSGLRADQVTQVRGFADQRLRDTSNPDAAANRRITLIVQYLPQAPNEAGATPKGGHTEAATPAQHGEAKH